MEQNLSKFSRVSQIIESYNFDKSKLIPILQTVQNEYKYLPEEVLVFVATALNISTARVYGVATFFAYFALEPKGKHIIKVCDGTACHVKRSEEIINSIKNKLQLKDNEKNSKDMMFALETVSCLGACGLAPVLVVDEKVYSQTAPDTALQIIDDIIAQEKESIAEEK